jgi:hypothetical protein
MTDLINFASAYAVENGLEPPPLKGNKLDTTRAPVWLGKIVQHAGENPGTPTGTLLLDAERRWAELPG